MGTKQMGTKQNLQGPDDEQEVKLRVVYIKTERRSSASLHSSPECLRMRCSPVSWLWPLVPLQLLLFGLCTDGYRPVVIVHGLFDGPKQFKKLTFLIRKVSPNWKCAHRRSPHASICIYLHRFSKKIIIMCLCKTHYNVFCLTLQRYCARKPTDLHLSAVEEILSYFCLRESWKIFWNTY